MIRRLTDNDIDEYIYLAHEVSNNLNNRDFLIPCSDEDLKKILENSNSKVYGYYYNNKLVASAQLNNGTSNMEMGGFLTLPEYRGKGFMKKLCNYILENNKYSKIIITVHPDNIPSKKVIKSLNANYICNKKINNYEREIYEIIK